MSCLFHVRYSILRVLSHTVGADSGEGPPVPIPNTEVKPYDAEDTLGENLGENMGLPIFLYNPT